MATKDLIVPAGRFKQQCLAIIDTVARTHRSVTISKRGKPVARLVPLEADREIEVRTLAELRSGQGGMLVDEQTFLRPTSDIAGWSET
jgi:prevent-host-death family protein